MNPTESVAELARHVLVNFVQLSSNGSCMVYIYATELLSLGLLWHGFHDAIKEGDSDRILCYWKLIIFKSTNHRNYAKEAVNLLYIFGEAEGTAYLEPVH